MAGILDYLKNHFLFYPRHTPDGVNSYTTGPIPDQGAMNSVPHSMHGTLLGYPAFYGYLPRINTPGPIGAPVWSNRRVPINPIPGYLPESTAGVTPAGQINSNTAAPL